MLYNPPPPTFWPSGKVNSMQQFCVSGICRNAVRGTIANKRLNNMKKESAIRRMVKGPQKEEWGARSYTKLKIHTWGESFQILWVP